MKLCIMQFLKNTSWLVIGLFCFAQCTTPTQESTTESKTKDMYDYDVEEKIKELGITLPEVGGEPLVRCFSHYHLEWVP